MNELSEIRFTTELAMSSNKRSYTKSIEVINLQAKKWQTPDGRKTRIYISGQVENGTSAQRGTYSLGYFEYSSEGKLMTTFPLRNTDDDQKCVVREYVKKMLSEE